MKNKAILLQCEDWEMLYVNGKLVKEGHTLGRSLGMTEYKAIMHLMEKYNFYDIDNAYYIENEEDLEYLDTYGSGKMYLNDWNGNYE